MISLLSEDNYLEAMNGPCRQWREAYVQEGDYTSFDETKLHYYSAIPEKAKAIIVMFHGFCEFYGKFHEMTWYFYQAGYGFFFPEMRGHGLSGGKLPDKDLVYVKTYDDYVRDMKGFYDRVVRKETPKTPKILFSHSMGGAIAALYLEEYPNDFQDAVLSSPMLRLQTGGLSPAMICLLRIYAHVLHKMKQISVGQHPFDGVPAFESSSCLSKARYDYIFSQRLKNTNYQTNAATFGWSLASLSATKKLIANAKKIQTPLFVFEAGNDHLVDPTGYIDFLSQIPAAQHKKYENARHEIYNADDDVRIDYYQTMLGTLDAWTT